MPARQNSHSVPEYYLRDFQRQTERWRDFIGPGGEIKSSTGWAPPGGWTPRKHW
jgi:hypothetical protein